MSTSASEMSLQDVLEPVCARGFLRQATRLSLTSKAVASALPMGTGKQIYEAAKAGRDEQLPLYLEYWRGNAESPEVLNWAPYKLNDSPLLAAAKNDRPSCVELLVALAPAVYVNKGTETALHWACRHGSAAMARNLLAAPGIDANKKSGGYEMPLHFASMHGHAEVVRLLVAFKGMELEPKDYDGRTPMRLAEKERQDAVKHIEHLELFLSLLQGNLPVDEIEQLEQLLSVALAKQLNYQDVITILTEAIERNKAPNAAGKQLWNAARSGVMARLRPLVDKWNGNADMLNWADPSRGFTPIHGAIYMSRLEDVQLLASTTGVDINKTDKFGWSPLIASVYIGNVDIVRFLLSVDGVDINKSVLHTDLIQRTALTIASIRASGETDEKWVRKQEIAALLRAAGAR